MGQLAATVEKRIPIDAETCVFNVLADAVTLGPLTWDDPTLSPKEREEELKWMSAHVLSEPVIHFQLSARRASSPKANKG
jgi:hypothetical protein